MHQSYRWHSFYHEMSRKKTIKSNRNFVKRKNKFALLHMAYCDSSRKLAFLIALNDQRAIIKWLSMSQRWVKRFNFFTWALKASGNIKHSHTIWHTIPGNYPNGHVLGDNAFTASFCMLFPEGNADTFDDHNFYHSSNRMNIGCVFGMLVRKWAM